MNLDDASVGGGPRGSRARRLTGVGLVLAGLMCLGWVAFQMFGTNVISERHFATETSQLKQQWQSPAPRPTAPAADPKEKAKTPEPLPGEALALLRVPKFGSDYEVPVLAGTSTDVLARGIGHYDGTALPGQVGNFAVAGHRITHGQPFSRLLELDKGDDVVVETAGFVYTYTVDRPPRDLTVPDTAGWVLDPVPGKPGEKATEATLTLTTCQDLFHSPDRSVGFAHLTRATPKR